MANTEVLDRVRENISKVVVGKESAIDLMLCTMLCGGHLLVEDVPGIGKTTLIRSLAQSISADFKRIQFTPDLLPSDITGFSMPDMKSGENRFVPGGIMSQIVIADEINRASPKTQAALLECMQEKQVTVDGITYPMSDMFMVLATQNPVEYTGTYLLPEAQLDRFMMCINLGYPTAEEEKEIMIRFESIEQPTVSAVASVEDILTLRKQVDEVICTDAIREYIIRIVEATRNNRYLQLGISPRGSLWLLRASKAWALMQDRGYVLPDDIQFLAPAVLLHRLITKPEAVLSDMDSRRILRNIMSVTAIPAGVYKE
ncbi:MAG: MoxR family ATPase [Oscillospiraceae bacterium]|nr:MoxR family ATPase [Oscillospiraceae bacterium]